jgi:hypothetical protein
MKKPSDIMNDHVKEYYEEIILQVRERRATVALRRSSRSFQRMIVQLCEAGTITVSNDDKRKLRDVCRGGKCKECWKDGQTSFDI